MTTTRPLSPDQRHKHRFAFLQHAQTVRPELLNELLLARPAWEDLERQQQEAMADSDPNHRRATLDALHNPRVRLLYKWARPFNLYVPWVLSFARARLRMWKFEESRQHAIVMEWTLAGSVTVYRMPDVEPLRLEFLWEPDVESRDKFTRRVVTETRAAASRYAGGIEKQLSESRDRDWRSVPLERPGRNSRALLWLAQYQVAGWNYQRIARADQRLAHVSAIPKAIKLAAEKIDLPLRPARAT